MDVEKCINKECVNYDKDDHNNCMTELNIKICPNHLMEKTEPVAEVPCSDGVMRSLIESEENRVKAIFNATATIGEIKPYNNIAFLDMVEETGEALNICL